MELKDLVPILQIALGPVILVSGVALLLLSMTNRFGRVIDRSRQLAHELHTVAPEHRPSVIQQIHILMKRARIVRAAIVMAALSVLLAALMIIVLFIHALLQLGYALPITILFCACMVCLIAALVLFIYDIELSLKALKLEVGVLKKEDE